MVINLLFYFHNMAEMAGTVLVTSPKFKPLKRSTTLGAVWIGTMHWNKWYEQYVNNKIIKKIDLTFKMNDK